MRMRDSVSPIAQCCPKPHVSPLLPGAGIHIHTRGSVVVIECLSVHRPFIASCSILLSPVSSLLPPLCRLSRHRLCVALKHPTDLFERFGQAAGIAVSEIARKDK